jgi:predicted lipopolysaccharide heptosyltransferase III
LKILLVRLRQIGDVVFTTPAIHALRRHYPDAHLTYLVEPAAAAVVATNAFLDALIVAPRARGWRGLASDVRLGLRLRRQRFDLTIDFHGGPRASLLAWMSGARQRIGYDIPGRRWMYTDLVPRARELRPRHSVLNQCDLLAPLGIAPPTPADAPVAMPANAAAQARVDARLSAGAPPGAHRLVVMHVSAGNPFRRWPLASFAAVAAALLARHPDTRVIVTSGPSEADAAARVMSIAREQLPPPEQARLEAWNDDFPLDELRALLERAALFIGGDSGPMHIAATSAVPIVSLYGPTLPARSAPWRPHPERAIAVEVHGLGCRPCDQRVCVTSDYRCLASLTPAQVADAAARLLGSDRVN